jgi:serine/threonine protein kinase
MNRIKKKVVSSKVKPRSKSTTSNGTDSVNNSRVPSNESIGSMNYEVVKEIGTGSFGKAILVRSKKDGKLYVMKRIAMKEMSEDERQGAMNEVKVLQLLKHKNIIAYHEYFQSPDGHLNIIMDYADGGDMFQRIRNQNNRWFNEEVRSLIDFNCILISIYLANIRLVCSDCSWIETCS